MKNYQYILLDWDGNLARTLDIWLAALKEPLARRGIHVSDKQIGASFGDSTQYLIDWGVKDVAAVKQETDDIAKEQLPSVELYPDALDVLQTLHAQGKKMALITSSRHEHVKHLLEKHNMAYFFDAIVASDDTKNHKPDPEPLEKALSALGGTKEQAIMIGDSDKDLGAARNFGIDSVLFYTPEHEKFYDIDMLKKFNPTYVFDDFKDILKIV